MLRGGCSATAAAVVGGRSASSSPAAASAASHAAPSRPHRDQEVGGAGVEAVGQPGVASISRLAGVAMTTDAPLMPSSASSFDEIASSATESL